MRKSNKNLWVNVEGLAVAYATENDGFRKELILEEIFEAMEGYINTCINNAVRNAQNYGLIIPREDFESRYFQYLWEALEAFDIEGESTFKNIVLRRFRFAETHTWRQYKSKGNNEDKDGVSYESARWDSLDRNICGGSSDDDKTLAEVIVGESQSAEEVFVDNNEEEEILKAFAKVNERYSNVIRFLYLGYEGDDLAKVTGEADKYDAKMRKLVQRSKDAFKKFMSERAFA